MQSKETKFESFAFTKVQKQRAKFIFDYIFKFLVFLHQMVGNLNDILTEVTAYAPANMTSWGFAYTKVGTQVFARFATNFKNGALK